MSMLIVTGRIFGDALRRARRQAGLPQQQFADRVGYSRAQIASMELGRAWPTMPLWPMLLLAARWTKFARCWAAYRSQLKLQQHRFRNFHLRN